MFRRSAFRLCQQASKETVRPGHKDATALDWVQTFINPFYHAARLSQIQEQVDSTKSRKWVIVGAALAYPVYFLLYPFWDNVRMASPDKDGNYPEVHWNDEKAGFLKKN
eukprot:Rhum_TRINITY_DN25102_c0_g1::Rhum_TRINITY_DN25102_c0_g1_i1::g.181228::m.181228